MKKVVILALIFLSASCAGIRVNYDYAPGTDFTAYRTYDYYPDMDTGLSELDTKRLLRAVDSVLQSRGLRLDEQPDFYVNIQSISYRSNPNSTVGVGMGGTGRRVGGGISVGFPIGGSGMAREIIFDFVDADRDALFWQAASNSNFSENASPNTRERVLRNIAIKVFSKYPPSK